MVEPSVYIYSHAPLQTMICLFRFLALSMIQRHFFHVNMRAVHIQMIYSKNKI